MPKYKATAYIRLSYTDDRSSESDSVANQRKLIENFVERNPDIEVVSYKVDDGYSGIIFDRPAFKEMMQDVTNGEINCVIVKDLSRLGREYIETGRYLRRVFPAYGVRFIAITDNIDTAQESSGDDLTVSVKNIMNEAYCRDISVKTRTSLDVKRRKQSFPSVRTVVSVWMRLPLNARNMRNRSRLWRIANNPCLSSMSWARLMWKPTSPKKLPVTQPFSKQKTLMPPSRYKRKRGRRNRLVSPAVRRLPRQLLTRTV